MGRQAMTTMLPSVAKIAELLGGDAQGGQVLCPGPGHAAGDRSLSVKPDNEDAEGFVVHSFADDDFKACRDYVRAKLGLPEPKKNGAARRGH
jgi:putative DNA primase/helicase